MTEDLLFILLSATSLSTLIWILWEKKQGRNWFGRWLAALGILMIPLILAKWLAPAAWMAPFTMPFFIKVFAALPFSFGLASVVGVLLFIVGLIMHAVFDALGKYEWSIDWNSDDEPSFSDMYGDDWRTDWIYEFNRDPKD
jgi:hypothetical protein